MGPVDQHPRDKETGDLIDTIAIHRIPQAVTDDRIRAMAPEGYVKVVVMFREGQGGAVGGTMMAYAQYRGWREARAAVRRTGAGHWCRRDG